MHLVGLIIKKFVTRHGHMNIKCRNMLLCMLYVHLAGLVQENKFSY
jgi:hypothetical protein